MPQIAFIMSKEDEAQLLDYLFKLGNIGIIDGVRHTSKDYPVRKADEKLEHTQCHVWYMDHVQKPKSRFIPTCNDYYLDENGLIQFFRSYEKDGTLFSGRFALSNDVKIKEVKQLFAQISRNGSPVNSEDLEPF